MKELLERCVGLDVHKKSITACVLIGWGKKTFKEIKTFGTTTPELYKLASWLNLHKISEVAMESTGIYWVPVYNVLEKDFVITLANPWHMKNIPGKKTDVKDAEWICTLLKHSLLRGSFIPPKNIRELRSLTRLRKKCTQLKTSAQNRIIKFLESCNIKLKSLVSQIDGVSSWKIIKAIAHGQNNPYELAALAKTIRASKEEIIAALTGFIGEHDMEMIQFAVEEVEFYEQQIAKIDLKIKKHEAIFNAPLEIIRSFPGIGEISGATIISEIGTNMKQFPTADHLASWAGLAPGNNESAGKVKSTRISTGNTYLKISLIQSAWSVIREKSSYWNAAYYRLKARLGAKKAIVAIARRMLIMIYTALRAGIKYHDLNLKDDPDRVNKSIEYYKKKLNELSQQPVAKAT